MARGTRIPGPGPVVGATWQGGGVEVLGWALSDPKLVGYRHYRAAPGVRAEWPEWFPTDLQTGLVNAGICQPWEHQRRAADLAWAHQHVAISTLVADSGKD